MSMQGVCAKCGFVFLLDYGLECPACVLAARAENVRKTFAPVDPLRTALGIHGSFRIKDGKVVPLSREELEEGSRGMRWHGEYYRPEAESDHPTMELSDDESGHRLARTLDADDAAQIYELRRLFRL